VPHDKSPPLRALLDQGFPKPKFFDPTQLDKRVEYTHLSDFDHTLSETSTPDWMVNLVAAHAGFDLVVTADRHQLDQELEVVAISCTRLTLVTWRHRINDSIVQWGMLVAYMPEIIKRMQSGGPLIVTLPRPNLSHANNIEKTSGVAHRYAKQTGQDPSTLRSAVMPDMKEELNERGRSELIKLLERAK
jgi:hypothetical protein